MILTNAMFELQKLLILGIPYILFGVETVGIKKVHSIVDCRRYKYQKRATLCTWLKKSLR